MADFTVPTWQYHDKNIQGDITQKDFTRGDRTIIYTSRTPLPGDTGTQTAFNAVGLIQGMSHSEQKQLQMLFELGSSNPMIVPGLTQGQISMTRVLLNGLDFLNSIYHGIDAKPTQDQILRSIRDVNRPFDMLVAQYPVMDDETAAASAVMTVLFRGCQIQAQSRSISAGGVVTLEQLSILYTSIPKVTFAAAAA